MQTSSFFIGGDIVRYDWRKEKITSRHTFPKDLDRSAQCRELSQKGNILAANICQRKQNSSLMDMAIVIAWNTETGRMIHQSFVGELAYNLTLSPRGDFASLAVMRDGISGRLTIKLDEVSTSQFEEENVRDIHWEKNGNGFYQVARRNKETLLEYYEMREEFIKVSSTPITSGSIRNSINDFIVHHDTSQLPPFFNLFGGRVTEWLKEHLTEETLYFYHPSTSASFKVCHPQGLATNIFPHPSQSGFYIQSGNSIACWSIPAWWQISRWTGLILGLLSAITIQIWILIKRRRAMRQTAN